jgi:hypothetical protein
VVLWLGSIKAIESRTFFRKLDMELINQYSLLSSKVRYMDEMKRKRVADR